MTTKTKNKGAKKAPRKLALNKETLRDLSAGGKAKAVRGGAGGLHFQTKCTCLDC